MAVAPLLCFDDRTVIWTISSARDKGVQYRFKSGASPFEEIEAFSSDVHTYHGRTVKNMKRMREIGLDTWIAEQKRKGQSLLCS